MGQWTFPEAAKRLYANRSGVAASGKVLPDPFLNVQTGVGRQAKIGLVLADLLNSTLLGCGQQGTVAGNCVQEGTPG